MIWTLFADAYRTHRRGQCRSGLRRWVGERLLLQAGE